MLSILILCLSVARVNMLLALGLLWLNDGLLLLLDPFEVDSAKIAVCRVDDDIDTSLITWSPSRTLIWSTSLSP